MRTHRHAASARTVDDVDGTDATLATLAVSLGIDVDELRRRIATPATPAAPTVAAHVDSYLARLTTATGETYGTHLARLVRGVEPVCDQQCSPCLERRLLRLEHRSVQRLEPGVREPAQ